MLKKVVLVAGAYKYFFMYLLLLNIKVVAAYSSRVVAKRSRNVYSLFFMFIVIAPKVVLAGLVLVYEGGKLSV